MKRYLTIVFACMYSLLIIGQQTILYADTFRLDEQVVAGSADKLLLDLVAHQSAEIANRQDSLFQLRLLADTTTAFPFHVGLADSLRIAKKAKQMAPVYPLAQPLIYFPAPPLSFSMQPDTTVNEFTIRQSARQYIASHHTNLYQGHLDKKLLDELHETKKPIDKYLSASIKAIVPDVEEDKRDAIVKVKLLTSNWYKESTVMLQLTQNYVSANWYQGGNSNFSVLGILQGTIKYNDHNRISWENTGEWRFGFNTVKADSLRKINTNEDVLKLYSKFGVKIVDKLNYSVSADFQTHFFNTWKENTKELKTGPFTPVRLNIATGLDYQPINGLSIYFAPLTYKLVYAADTIHASQTNFSIDRGRRSLNEVGSSLRVEWQYKPVREVELESKLYVYTNYHRVEIDWETTCNFIITRYISARLMIHPRYDNTVILEGQEKAKIQFKELLSIGFTHKFR